MLLSFSVWGEGSPGCAGAVALLGILTALHAVALRPYTFMSLSPSCRMLWAAVLVGQPFVGVNMLPSWLCKGFLLSSSLLSWFKGAEQYAKLSP